MAMKPTTRRAACQQLEARERDDLDLYVRFMRTGHVVTSSG